MNPHKTFALTETAKFSSEGLILLMGDFNARSGTLPDYITNDSPTHLHALPPEYTSDEVWPRISEDKKVNNYGKEQIDLCISSRLRILNGRIGMDREQGAFTCVTPRGSSMVDYSVASIDLFKLIADFNSGENFRPSPLDYKD